MRHYVVLKAASRRIADIYRYSLDHWGREQARNYVDGLFEVFDDIASGKRQGRPIPKTVGISGWYVRYKSHFVFWAEKDAERIAILSVLHERMKMVERLPEDIEKSSKESP